ncbi:MAG: NYN domain-containing protein [Rikenellaceae bacterium]|nr:NYN domain-containing protein [Rikenellaceae bacterium]
MANPNYAPLKIGVFYDGNLFLHISNYYTYSHPQRSRIDIEGLHKYILNKVADAERVEVEDCIITETQYFRGRLSAYDATKRGNQLYNDRVFEDILMGSGVQTHYMPLREMNGKKEEKGIYVWLALSVYKQCIQNNIDVAVMIVSDTEYLTLFRELKNLGVRVMLLSWDFKYMNDSGNIQVTRTSYELLNIAKYPVDMIKEIDNGLENNDKLIEGLFVVQEQEKDADLIEIHESGEGEILSIKNGCYGLSNIRTITCSFTLVP